MISYLKGRFLEQSNESVIVEVNGVGYEVVVSQAVLSVLKPIGSEISLVIYTEMRDSSITLYGFADRSEREVFLLLRKVNGVGPRTALSIVSTLGTAKIYRSIADGDLSSLKQVSGVGKKTAERIIVELREHVDSLIKVSPLTEPGGATRVTSHIPISREIEVSSFESGPQNDAFLALTKLGFTRDQAQTAVKTALAQIGDLARSNNQGDIAGEILKHALANIPVRT